MNVKDFEYLLAIAADESISKAAAKLYLSQPTLSKFLQKIESEYGELLFYRVGKKMIPTPAGKICLEKAAMIVEMNNQLNQQIFSLQQKESGYLRIGTSASRGDFFISQVIPEMSRKYPNTRFYLVMNTKNQLMHQLEKDELDIIFVNNSSERPYLQYKNLVNEEMVVVVPNDHRLNQCAVKKIGFRYPYIEMEEWIRYPFILADSRMITGQYVRMLFEHYEKTPTIVFETNSLQHIYLAVENKVGITIAPNVPLPPLKYDNINYLSFEDNRNIQWFFTAITKAQFQISPLVEDLISTVERNYLHLGDIREN